MKQSVVLGAVALSWFGLIVHNAADLSESVLGASYLFPTLVYLFLAAAWLRSGGGRVASWLLLGWCVLHLVGGGLVSVLPLPFLPFDPAQTMHHYVFHVLYALTQIPLLVVLGQWLRHRSQAPG